MSISFVSQGEQINNYSFNAGTLAEALEQLTRLGPRDGDGHHAAGCDMRAGIMEGLQTGIVPGSVVQVQAIGWNGNAEITQAAFRYGFVFTFPDWANIGSLSQPIQSEWQRYKGCLWVHERGHVQTAMTVLRRYLKQFQDLRINGTGANRQTAEEAAQRELRIQVQAVYDLLAYENQQENNRYDQRTRHGRIQGAQLRTRAPRGSRY